MLVLCNVKLFIHYDHLSFLLVLVYLFFYLVSVLIIYYFKLIFLSFHNISILYQSTKIFLIVFGSILKLVVYTIGCLL